MEPRIICTELYVRLADDDVLVLDCRSEEDWEGLKFHIPGALRMPPAEVARDLGMLPDDELIILCGSRADGSDVLRLCRLLLMRGRNAVWLQGGIQQWLAEGFPVERHVGQPMLAVQPA